MTQDSKSHVACEVLCKDNQVVIAGEIKSNTNINIVAVVRQAIRDIGYTDPFEPFNADGVKLLNLLGQQSSQIDQGVSGLLEQGAGDQGLVFGFACDETPERMPLPISLAHALSRKLADDRKVGLIPWSRPDGKTQVTVRYQEDKPVEVTDVVISTQHTKQTNQEDIQAYMHNTLLPSALGRWHKLAAHILVNPTGEFSFGGPSADAGVTGRKIIVDTYGGYAHHGGGAFSGKDPSKVDRSAAYFTRFVAKQVVLAGLAPKVEIQVAYAIGVARPVSVFINTFGVGDLPAIREFVRQYDFRPAAIIERLNLLRPIYRETTNYGHFGKASLPWEQFA